MRTLAWVFIVTATGVGALAGQERELRGRILPDEAGVPWAGAAVVVQETGRVVCADANGRFTLPLPADRETRLSVQPVGFPPTELTVTPADDEMLIPFASHVVHLEGVVVTAYAEVAPPGSPFGVSVVDSSDLTRVPGTLPSTLSGKVAGAAVSHNSGAPGGGVQLDIRGVRTILGNAEPLIVVDGVPMTDATVGTGTSLITGSRPDEEDRSQRVLDLSTLDIARVEVLKGVGAAQQYGPRAANGVLVITTRRGRYAEPEAGPDPSLACYRPAG